MKLIRLLSICLLGLSLNFGAAQSITISGYVKDAETGETLIGANIYSIENPNQGTTSNAYGFYSLSVPQGDYRFSYSYLGYNDNILEINLSEDVTLDVELSVGVLMDEVVVSADKDEKEKNIQSTQMGVIELPMESVKKIPALMGEVDVLKVIQLLPGVLSVGEGNSGFYVRGGGPDQNLVLLDEAIVYNSGHMLGFFSVFNSDAIKNTTLIKGGMPANYGGRLSSVVDIAMKEGNMRKYTAEGGVGLISSRLTLQGPIKKDVSSFMLSGRRTYVLDLVQPFLEGGNFEGTNYYFYDLNAKVNYKFSDKDRLFFSTYFGRDVLDFNQPVRDFEFTLPYGNSTATLRWNHLFNNKLFMNLSAVYNDYQFSFNGGQDEFRFRLFSGVKDYNLKLDFDYFPNNKHAIKYGLNYTYHVMTPNTASASTPDIEFMSDIDPKYANETAVYIVDDWKINSKVSLNFGVRGSVFSQVGPYTSTIDGREYEDWENVKTYFGIEPRFSSKLSLSKTSSLKLGLSYTTQYLHLVSNSSSTLPTDVWVPSTERVLPQYGVQYAAGYFQNFAQNKYETSLEIYYKDLDNQIDYADNTVNEIGVDEELKFVFGDGRAYGMELFLKKATGRLNGWIGYTLSRSEKSFPDIEDGRWYPTTYDRTHDLSVVANYEINKKFDISGVFIYGTGKTYTPISGFYFLEQELNTFYGPRNSARLEPYHRFDLSLTYTPNPKSQRKFRGTWNLSVYNAYNRKNPFFIYYDDETNFEQGTTEIKAFKVTIFPIIPSISYNFKWNQ